MNPHHLYLLKSGFQNQGKGPYYCPGCAELVGLLELYPVLKQHLEIHFIDFKRPRPDLVSLLGEENQSCPVLVLSAIPSSVADRTKVQYSNGHAFVEGANDIGIYLSHTYETGIPYPPAC